MGSTLSYFYAQLVQHVLTRYMLAKTRSNADFFNTIDALASNESREGLNSLKPIRSRIHLSDRAL